MEVGPPQAISLARFMADKGAVWDSVVSEHGLQPIPYDALGEWSFADWVFATDWDYLMSDVKRMQLGFTEVVDTEEMFLRILSGFRRDRIIP